MVWRLVTETSCRPRRTSVRRGLSLYLRAFATKSVDSCDNIGVFLRTGDKAILIGAAAIVWYERKVADDADLISSRVSAYRQHMLGRLVTDAVILATALHLAAWHGHVEIVDLYHVGVRYIRRNVGGQE